VTNADDVKSRSSLNSSRSGALSARFALLHLLLHLLSRLQCLLKSIYQFYSDSPSHNGQEQAEEQEQEQSRSKQGDSIDHHQYGDSRSCTWPRSPSSRQYVCMRCCKPKRSQDKCVNTTGGVGVPRSVCRRSLASKWCYGVGPFVTRAL